MQKQYPEKDILVVTAEPELACGVGDFTHRLMAELSATRELRITREQPSLKEVWSGVRGSRGLVFNLPLVGWKRIFLQPIAAVLSARVQRVPITLMLHEWGRLHWARRLTYWPAIISARSIVMFSPQVRAELAADTWLAWASRKVTLAPLPPNLARPEKTATSAISDRLGAARASGQLVIGTFGSIYPGKEPAAALEIVAELENAGHAPLMVFVGSFISATDHIEEAFWKRVHELAIQDSVIVTGFIESTDQLFGIFEQIDVFIYRLNEGITARRASVLTTIQSDSPVVVTAPKDGHEFDHHPRFRKLIEEGKLVLVRRDASVEAYRKAIVEAKKSPRKGSSIVAADWWRDLVSAVKSIV